MNYAAGVKEIKIQVYNTTQSMKGKTYNWYNITTPCLRSKTYLEVVDRITFYRGKKVEDVHKKFKKIK